MTFSRSLLQQAAQYFYFQKNTYSGDYTELSFPISSGSFISSGSVNHDYFQSELDGDMVVKTFDNFVINEGHMVTTTNRCKGLCLNILGDCTINGTLSMTARGANAEGQNIAIDPIRNRILFDIDEDNYIDIPAIGANGAIGIVATVSPQDGSLDGKTGIDGASGGGGAGGSFGGHGGRFPRKGGDGSAGTSFSGGSGGSGACGNFGGATQGNNAQLNGGKGGDGVYRTNLPSYGGSGAGNPAGSASYSSLCLGEDGTGGLLILIVKGKLIIGSTGIIEANGSDGGDYLQGITNSRYSAGGGGGSGGGSVNIFHRNTLINDGVIRADGGIGGISTNSIDYATKGGSGGAGSIRVSQI